MKLNVLGYGFWNVEGYGRYITHTCRALARQGVEVVPLTLGQLDMPGDLQRMAGIDFARPTLAILPGGMLPALPGRVWLLSMYECTRLPTGWAQKINKNAERLIVPCEQNKEAFHASGVRVPIHVVHGGTEPSEFPVIPNLAHSRPYTFLCMFDRGVRKGIEQALAAFCEAFPAEGYPDVRLVIKVREHGLPGISPLSFDDTRICLWQEDVRSFYDVFSQVDCFVFPSLGEGWGMPPREAAMMGVPVIATNWSGLEVGIQHWALPINKFVMQDTLLDAPKGKWAKPDVAEVAKQMRWCYENPAQARAFGQRAAAWLRANQTWDHSACAMVKLFKEQGLCR